MRVCGYLYIQFSSTDSKIGGHIFSNILLIIRGVSTHLKTHSLLQNAYCTLISMCQSTSITQWDTSFNLDITVQYVLYCTVLYCIVLFLSVYLFFFFEGYLLFLLMRDPNRLENIDHEKRRNPVLLDFIQYKIFEKKEGTKNKKIKILPELCPYGFCST